MEKVILDVLRSNLYNKEIRGKEILDIGSTVGNIHRFLVSVNRNKRFYSLDIEGSPDFKMDLNNPKNLHKKFDTIIAGEILEHVENPSKLLRFCFNHLKKGGILILSTPNAIGLQYIRNPSWCSNRKGGHINSFTMPMLKFLFVENGFTIVREQYINPFWIHKNPMQFIPVMFPRLKTDLFIVGERK